MFMVSLCMLYTAWYDSVPYGCPTHSEIYRYMALSCCYKTTYKRLHCSSQVRYRVIDAQLLSDIAKQCQTQIGRHLCVVRCVSQVNTEFTIS